MKKIEYMLLLLFVFLISCGFRFQDNQILYTNQHVVAGDEILKPLTEVYAPVYENGVYQIFRKGKFVPVEEKYLSKPDDVAQRILDIGGVPSQFILKDTGSNTIMLGDSRTVHMQWYWDERTFTYVAEGTKGFDWMENVAVPIMETGDLKNKKIIIWMGANDIWVGMDINQAVENYMQFYQTKCREWMANGAEIYIVSVGPVKDSCEVMKNERIDTFNALIRARLPKDFHYIDVSDYLKQNMMLIDEVHYHPNTCAELLKIFVQETNK